MNPVSSSGRTAEIKAETFFKRKINIGERGGEV
jgi:hypothetical protein